MRAAQEHAGKRHPLRPARRLLFPGSYWPGGLRLPDLHLAFLKECRPHAYGEMLFAGKLFPRGFQALHQRGMEQMR